MSKFDKESGKSYYYASVYSCLSMALEADLGVLTVKSKDIEQDENVEQQADFTKPNKKEEIHQQFVESKAGIAIQKKLVALKDDARLSIEDKKTNLVELIKDFFEVGDGDDEDEHIQRLVDKNGKQFLRIKVGIDFFDIGLEAKNMKNLIKGFINQHLERIASIVNGDEQKEDNKIQLVYDESKLAIEETKRELAALQKRVVTGTSVVASGVKKGLKRKEVWGSIKTGDFSTLPSYLGQYFDFGISATSATVSIASFFTKDPVKLQKTKDVMDGFVSSLTNAKNAVVNAFTPSSTPEGTLS